MKPEEFAESRYQGKTKIVYCIVQLTGKSRFTMPRKTPRILKIVVYINWSQLKLHLQNLALVFR